MTRTPLVFAVWLNLLVLPLCAGFCQRAAPVTWRAANAAELEAVLPSRAPVEREHIETEMRTATGVVNNRKQFVAAVVLITAGYAADGKYSHFLLVQVPVLVDGHVLLKPGSYVVGWRRTEAGLEVHLFDSASGVEQGTGMARPEPSRSRVEAFHIWPPDDRRGIQIGRFYLPYALP